MVKKVVTSIAAGVIALGLSLSAQAAFVSLDWKAGSDGLVTLDTTTGLEWLDITEARDLSFDQVSGQLGDGGQYSGFRYASGAEVMQLLKNFGFEIFDGNYRTENYAAATDLFNFVGSVYFSGDSDVLVGRVGDIGEPGYNLSFSIASCHTNSFYSCPVDINYEAPTIEQSSLVWLEYIPFDSTGYVYSSWLVKDASVSLPEPGVIPLTISALLILFFSRRIRNSVKQR
ncbi:MAG: hypothetical protein EOP48_09110 [Sphingobacteriales bacterium]|nr:MAG: hypothetical protein EOP48_09110 [Sphingobacteriales bacterium]